MARRTGGVCQVASSNVSPSPGVDRQPSVVLADEPTGALDSRAAEAVVGAFAEAHLAGQTIVMVTHDPAVAASADRIVHMRDGRIDAGWLVGWSAPVARTA